MTLGKVRARKIVKAFSDLRILVIGDLMLDRYIYGAVRRISPEAPVPVVSVKHEKGMPGGASNVAWNVQTLGAQSDVAGVIGEDANAEALSALLRQGGVGVEAVLRNPGGCTTVKTRVIAERQQVVRVDREAALHLEGDLLKRFCTAIREATARVDGVIIEDYGKGVICQAVVDAALTAAEERNIPVGYDPKDDQLFDVRGVTVATPNRAEAYASVGRVEPLEDLPPLEDAGLLDVGQVLQEKWGVEWLIITLGPQGMLLLEKNEKPKHIPTCAREVFDVSGAGDTVIATSMLARCAGATAYETVELANYAAGLVVAQLGTAPCEADALLESIP